MPHLARLRTDPYYTDPYYELPALHLGRFGGEKTLLWHFLRGYAWPVDPDFARRAMRMTLVHGFNVLEPLAAAATLHEVGTPEELADRLWRLDDSPSVRSWGTYAM